MTQPPALDTRLSGFDTDGKVMSRPAEKHEEIGRSPFERDIDRLKYTREFRRLKDVTQVARAGETYLYHDRLTHTLKVAQVGRRLAEYLLRRKIANELGDKFADRPPHEQSLMLARGKGYTEVDADLANVLDPDVVEAGCIAHDMGHPPFGHIAEEELDILLQEKTNPEFNGRQSSEKEGRKLVKEINKQDQRSVASGDTPTGIRFEGNAQSFRILTRLASYKNSETGLGLTYAVLNAVQKYPYGRGEWDDDSNETESAAGLLYSERSSGKFGYYKSERRAFETIREVVNDGRDRTLAAEIMDFADDLTYAIHDLFDFYRDGRLPLDQLLTEARALSGRDIDEGSELYRFSSYYRDKNDASAPAERVLRSLAGPAYSIDERLFKPYEDQEEAIEAFTSYLIGYYLNEHVVIGDKLPEKDGELILQLTEAESGYHLATSEQLKFHIDVLQELTKYYVIRDTALMGQQHGQRKVLRDLFDALYDEAGKEDPEMSAIPVPYARWLSTNDNIVGRHNSRRERRARIVCDFICSMTEPQAVRLHQRISGQNPGSLQNEIVR